MPNWLRPGEWFQAASAHSCGTFWCGGQPPRDVFIQGKKLSTSQVGSAPRRETNGDFAPERVGIERGGSFSPGQWGHLGEPALGESQACAKTPGGRRGTA